MTLSVAGADILIMRHPDAIALVKEMLQELMGIKGEFMSDEKVRSIDKATIELLEKAEKENVSTVFFRADAMKPCPIGVEESCCKICAMGPCRMPRSKKAGEEKAQDGRLRRHDRHRGGQELCPEDRGRYRHPFGPCPGSGGDLPQGGPRARPRALPSRTR